MTSAHRLALTVAAVVLFVSTGFAQQPDPLLGFPVAARPADPLLNPSPLPTLPVEPRDTWRVAVDVGLPVGVRVQRRLGESDWWGEVGVGAWWVVPYASACLRYDCTLLKRERNLFAVRPGVSATCVLLGPNVGVGADCEFVWQHTFNGKVTTELGLRLGMTAVFLDRRDSWLLGGTLPVPVVCLMWSCQF